MRLPLSTLVLYALPALPLAALTLPLAIIVPTFYAEALGLSLGVVGAALLAVRIFDAVTDPLVGWAADRWRPAFGRRRAMFALSLPITALGVVMLFWPPVDAGSAYLIAWGAVLSLGYTMAIIPLTAWGAEMAGGYAERSRVAGFREGFILLGTLVAIALPFAIGIETVAGLHGLAVLGLAVAAAMLGFGLLALWRVPEPHEHSRGRVDFGDGLRHMASNGPFLRLIAAFLVNGLANGIPATLFLYFVSDRLGLPEMRGPLLFAFFLSGILGVPVALAAARRLGKHRAWCVAMLFACAVFAFAPFVPAGNWQAFAAICVLTGLTLGFDLSLPASIQADVIDIDTDASGEQRSGMYFAAWSLATKLALALAVGLAFPALALFGFRPGEANEPQALAALAFAYAWVPIALKLAAIAMMWNFPLGEDLQRELRARIERA